MAKTAGLYQRLSGDFWHILQEKAESTTKLITQFGENHAQLILQMALVPHPQSQSLASNFCRLIMVNKYLQE